MPASFGTYRVVDPAGSVDAARREVWSASVPDQGGGPARGQCRDRGGHGGAGHGGGRVRRAAAGAGPVPAGGGRAGGGLAAGGPRRPRAPSGGEPDRAAAAVVRGQRGIALA